MVLVFMVCGCYLHSRRIALNGARSSTAANLSPLIGAGPFGVSNEHDDSTDECRRALAKFPNNIWDWEKSFQ